MPGRILFIFLCILLLAAAPPATAQQPRFINYSLKDGLPSMEVYAAFQDSKGYMWFGTDAGVTKFDGYTFRTFTTTDGLADNTIFDLFEDSLGRIWLRTFNGKICYIANDSVFVIPANSKIKKDLGSGMLTSLYVDMQNVLWVGKQNTLDKCYYSIAPPYGEADLKKNCFKGSNTPGISVIRIKGSHYIYTDNRLDSAQARPFIKKKYFVLLNLEKNSDSPQSISDPIDAFRSTLSKMISFNDTIYIANHSNIYALNKSQLLAHYQLEQGVTSIYHDSTNGMWIGLRNGGVRYYPSGKLDGPFFSYLKDFTVTSVYKDRDGGIWVTTLEAGLFYTPSIALQYYNKSNGLPGDYVQQVLLLRGNSVITGHSNGCYMFSHAAPAQQKQLTNRFVFDIDTLDHERLLINTDSGILVYSLLDWKIKERIYPLNPPKKTSVKDSVLYAIGIRALVLFDKKSLKPRDSIFTESRITCLETRPFQVCIGTIDGLFIYQGKKLIQAAAGEPLLRCHITDIKCFRKNYLIVATKGSGIFIVSENDKVIRKICTKNGLPEDLCNLIHVDSHDNVWVSGNRNLCRIRFDDEFNPSISNYSIYRESAINGINKICSRGDTLWLATRQGLVFFPVPGRETAYMPFYISNLNINNQSFPTSKPLILDHTENNIDLDYKAVSFKSLGKIIYRYKLKQEDSTWQYTQNTRLSLRSLVPGHYQVQIQALGPDGRWSKMQQVIFSIKKPIWQNAWAIAITILGCALLTLFIIRRRYLALLRREKEKLVLANKMHELEMKAFRAQMNPHFIFNSLSSIQKLILSDLNKEAYRYLSKFSKMVRSLLENSTEDKVSLASEIETLKIYLDMESLRFQHSFSYTIDVQENAESNNIYIPALLMQPYIENSLWHGLMHKEGERTLVVTIKLQENFIVCTIDDNGVGRKRSTELNAQRKEPRKSIGMHITRERLELINRKIKSDLSVRITDKYNSDGTSAGTTIELKIPFEKE